LKNRIVLALVGVFLFVLFSGNVRAAFINVDLGSGAAYTLGGAVVPGNIDLQSLKANHTLFANYDVSGITLKVRDAAIVKGDTPHGLFAHVRPTGIDRQTHYLAVFGHSPFYSGRAIFQLGAGINTFAFNWGSIDAYNKLTFIDGNNHRCPITGTDILNAVAGLIPGESSEYISISSLAGIKRVILSSRHNAFEVANISAVPLPAALPLFGASLLGLYGMKRRKGRTSV